MQVDSGSVLLLAVPGSGKTTDLATRQDFVFFAITIRTSVRLEDMSGIVEPVFRAMVAIKIYLK